MHTHAINYKNIYINYNTKIQIYFKILLLCFTLNILIICKKYDDCQRIYYVTKININQIFLQYFYDRKNI